MKDSIFTHPTIELAQELLGHVLVHESFEGRTAGRIVETEAYLFRDDPACHAHRGKTKRNATMFDAAGVAYVYLIYGMYYCFNVVSGEEGEGEAVLIRALEPVDGVDLMRDRRGRQKETELCSGPGKLTMAMGITSEHDGVCLRKSRLYLDENSRSRVKRSQIVQTTRIGITAGADLPLRWYLQNSPHVSQTM